MSEPHLQSQIDRLYRRLRMILAPVRINTTDDTGTILKSQISVSGTPEIIDAMPVMHFYGFNSIPPKDTDATALFIGGDRSNPVILGTNNQQYRPKNWKAGEIGSYTDEGDLMKFARDRAISITAGNTFGVDTKAANIKGSNTVTLDTPNTTHTGDVKALGKIDASQGFFQNGNPIGGSGSAGPPGPAGPQGPPGPAGPNWLVGPGLHLDTGTTPSTIDVATPYLPTSGGIVGSLTVTGSTTLAVGTATTPTTTDNSTRIATTAYVRSQSYLTGNQTISITGDASGSGTTSIPLTLATVNANVGTFQGLTVNAKGLVTAAANQGYLTSNQTITHTGDVTGSGTTSIANTVVGLQGRTVASTTPTTSQVLQWSGTQWVPATPAAGGLTTISDAAPATPTVGQQWFDSIGAQTYLWFNDGTSSQWVPVNNPAAMSLPLPVSIANGGTNATTAPAALTSLGALPLAGGVLTGALVLSGNAAAALNPVPLQQLNTTVSGYLPLASGTLSGTLTINAAGPTWSDLALVAAAGEAGRVLGLRAGVLRWEVKVVSEDAETGSNAGGNFIVNRYSDAGAALGAALTLNRASGQVTLSGGTTPLLLTNPGTDCFMRQLGSHSWAVGPQGALGDYWFYDDTRGTLTMAVAASNGACFNATGTWSALSDISLKQDVQPYTRGLDAILQLEPVAFRYQKGTPFAPKDEPSQVLYGLVAQDVEPHIPEVVGHTTATVGEEQREVATLNGGDLIYALINSVKELNAKIAALEAGLPPGLTPLPAE